MLVVIPSRFTNRSTTINKSWTKNLLLNLGMNTPFFSSLTKGKQCRNISTEGEIALLKDLFSSTNSDDVEVPEASVSYVEQLQQSRAEWDYLAKNYVSHLQPAIDQHIPYLMELLRSRFGDRSTANNFTLYSPSSSDSSSTTVSTNTPEERGVPVSRSTGISTEFAATHELNFYPAPRRILDIGCGAGSLARALSMTFPYVAGPGEGTNADTIIGRGADTAGLGVSAIDISDEMIRRARALSMQRYEVEGEADALAETEKVSGEMPENHTPDMNVESDWKKKGHSVGTRGSKDGSGSGSGSNAVTFYRASWPLLPAELSQVQFDIITCTFTLMYMNDPVANITEMKRKLSPGGVVALCCWGTAAENPWLSIPQAILRRQKEGQELPVNTSGASLLAKDRHRDDYTPIHAHRLSCEQKLLRKFQKAGFRPSSTHVVRVSMDMEFEKGSDQIIGFFSFLSNRNKVLLKKIFSDMGYGRYFPASFLIGIARKELDEV